MERPHIIAGGTHKDDRGIISFVNDFQFAGVERFYAIEHPDVEIVRAWQGHKKENKWFFVVAGCFKVVAVRLDDWSNPSRELVAEEFVLSADSTTGILHIPGGYANGFKAISANSKVIIFSDATVEASTLDHYRFDQELWYDWNKK